MLTPKMKVIDALASSNDNALCQEQTINIHLWMKMTRHREENSNNNKTDTRRSECS